MVFRKFPVGSDRRLGFDENSLKSRNQIIYNIQGTVKHKDTGILNLYKASGTVV
jgi:hypothetical protein